MQTELHRTQDFHVRHPRERPTRPGGNKPSANVFRRPDSFFFPWISSFCKGTYFFENIKPRPIYF